MKPWTVGVVSLVSLTTLMLVFRGCDYGPVSPTAYEYAKAIYSVCNRHDEERIPEVEQRLLEAARNGDITEQEQKWLMAILGQARAGEWDDATQEARRLMMDQVVRS